MNNVEFKEKVVKAGIGESELTFFEAFIEYLVKDDKVLEMIDSVDIHLANNGRFIQDNNDFEPNISAETKDIILNIRHDKYNSIYIEPNKSVSFDELIPLFELYGFTVEEREHAWLDSIYDVYFNI